MKLINRVATHCGVKFNPYKLGRVITVIKRPCVRHGMVLIKCCTGLIVFD